MKTRTISFVAVCSALSVVLLYVMSVMPTMRVAVCAVVSAATAVTVIRWGKKAGTIQYVVSSLLAFLLLPEKGVAAVYAIFIGHYPVCKSVIEGLNRLWLEWLLKIILFNLCFAAAYLLMVSLTAVELPVGTAILFAGGNIVFIIYDMALTVLIDFIAKRTRII